MIEFPRTRIEGLSVSRLVIGCNWFLGFSHMTRARDDLIKTLMDSRRIADVLETFLRAGVDTLIGIRPNPVLQDAVKDAEDRVGRKIISMATPSLDIGEGPRSESENRRILDENARTGAAVCMPHQQTTDALVDRRGRAISGMERYLAMIRERDMIPGLSTHMPETVKYADETELDAACYVQIYNAAGFLMQLEVDWVNRIIWEAKRPVLVIKPLAAGRLSPLVGLAFVWSTIRERDMVAVGTMSPDEAREVIDLSLSILDRRRPAAALQMTRSKASVS